MLDKLVNGKPEMAQVDFHDYLRAKLHGALGGKSETPSEDTQEITSSKI